MPSTMTLSIAIRAVSDLLTCFADGPVVAGLSANLEFHDRTFPKQKMLGIKRLSD
ncbi:hypothetical protein PMIT1342_00628 [Prochlorococcus marinus str. MIT 1342]|nr:hypothetical protein PMIT1342_00628 [Prochlorococcus marinus str. MIT 1342]